MSNQPSFVNKGNENPGDSYLSTVRSCLDEIAGQNVDAVAEAIYQSYTHGGQVFTLGNGGSAATASHMACDLAKTASVPGVKPIRVTSLTDNVALITAIGNDLGGDAIFEQQLIGHLKPGDVIICISASGNSPNVLKAAKYARQIGSRVIAFTGFSGGQLKALADICIDLECREYGPVEDTHLMLEHMVTVMLHARMNTPR